MREDMDKVLIERPRACPHIGKQPKGSRKLLNPYQTEKLTNKQSMRRPWKIAGQAKQFSDLLGPLKRFLRKKVGKKWDDIYSEIRENISPNSKMQLHLLDHVYDYVEQNVRIVNGRVIAEHGPLGTYRTYEQYYVHPETSLLTQAPRITLKKPESRNIKWANKEKFQQYVCWRNVWYWVQLKRLPSYMSYVTLHDVLFKKDVTGYTSNNYNSTYGGFYYAVKKRQLNKKEIRILGLRIKD